MWETLWTFRTERFVVELACAPECDPDVSWMDAAQFTALERGELSNVTFRVRVLLSGCEIGSDYLGNSVYADVRDFASEHRSASADQRNTLETKARGICVCTYFPSMVREAISQAREELQRINTHPRSRSRLKGTR